MLQQRSVAVLSVIISLCVFLAVASYQINLPGFYYDEALDLVPMLQLLHGENPELLRGIGMSRYPVMLLDYMGSWGGYITLPFMQVLGVGVIAARAQPIFFAAITIVLTWLLARKWFGEGVAAITALLLAVNPSFVWFTRQGISVSSSMTVCSIGSLLMLTHIFSQSTWSKPKTNFAWVGVGLLLGLGLWAKVLFLRWVVVLIIMGVWLFISVKQNITAPIPTQRQPMAKFASGFIFLCVGVILGSLLLIYYNVAGIIRDGSPPTLSLLFKALTNPTQQFGVDNRNIFANLAKSWDDVRVFIDGSYFWYNGTPFSNIFAFPAVIIAAVLGAPLSLKNNRTSQFGALVIAVVTLIFLGAFTVSGLWSTHQYIMLPLPQMIVACAVVWLVQWLTERKSQTMWQTVGVALVVLSPVIYNDVWVNAQHHRVLSETGGTGRFSDAIYKLADYLDSNHQAQPIALDWGIEKQIRILTNDRVRPLEVFGYTPEPDDAFRERIRGMLGEHRQYIVLWDRFAVYNRRSEFTRLANTAGKQVNEVFIAHERSGLPVYVVLQVK